MLDDASAIQSGLTAERMQSRTLIARSVTVWTFAVASEFLRDIAAECLRDQKAMSGREG